MSLKMRVLVVGIGVKLERGENLETILSSYVNLSESDKNIIRLHFNEGVGET